MNKYRKQFLLDPSITHLNHGSFGATPISIMDEYSHWQRKLEINPVDFIDNQLPNLVQESRHKLSGFLNCDKDDIVYCPNPTTALNTSFFYIFSMTVLRVKSRITRKRIVRIIRWCICQ